MVALILAETAQQLLLVHMLVVVAVQVVLLVQWY